MLSLWIRIPLGDGSKRSCVRKFRTLLGSFIKFQSEENQMWIHEENSVSPLQNLTLDDSMENESNGNKEWVCSYDLVLLSKETIVNHHFQDVFFPKTETIMLHVEETEHGTVVSGSNVESDNAQVRSILF